VVLKGSPSTRMARRKTIEECLYTLMSEVISLRERVAQAELAVANSSNSTAEGEGERRERKVRKRRRPTPTAPASPAFETLNRFLPLLQSETARSGVSRVAPARSSNVDRPIRRLER
jgi:hypothetical protein